MMRPLNRRIHRAYQRTRDANFSLEGLTGFTMYGKTAGVIGTGKIGVAMLRILKGFGMRLLAFDPYPSAAALELVWSMSICQPCSLNQTLSLCTAR